MLRLYNLRRPTRLDGPHPAAALAGPLLAITLAAAALPGARAQSTPEVLVAQSDSGVRVELHRTAGVCVMPARRAVWHGPRGQTIEGCWVTASGLVQAVFVDGDVLTIPAQHFREPQRL